MRASIGVFLGRIAIPLAILLLLIAAFGLLIPWLGLYWDDWETILVIDQLPLQELVSYFPGDRPLAAWTYLLFAPILGARPIHWHVFSLTLRWITVLGMWWSLSLLWEGERPKIARAALLFAVYPVFFQQAISVAYHQHWIAYALFFVSIGLMVLAVRRRGIHRLLLLAVSVLLLVLNLATFEYFVGVELLRPLIIWVALKQDPSVPTDGRLRMLVASWSPFIAVLLLYSIWRVEYGLENPLAANPPLFLYELGENPLEAAAALARLSGVGLWRIMVQAWIGVLEPRLTYPAGRMSIAAWLVGLAAAVLVSFALGKGRVSHPHRPWWKSWEVKVLAFGILSAYLGSLPVWITGRQVMGSWSSDRFALASMFGASLAWVALVLLLPVKSRAKDVILASMMGLAVVAHFRVANDFRASWAEQKEFHWQLFWRAPAIMPNTALVTDGDLYGYTRPSFSVNVLYQRPVEMGELPYSSFLLSSLGANVELHEEGSVLTASPRQFRFHARLEDILVVHESPSSDCFWILTAGASNEPGLGARTKAAALLSNTDRILRYPTSDEYPPTRIFGKEPEHDWCYFFQKAELARQGADWREVSRIGETARDAGYLDPEFRGSAHELLPFIEGYAMTNQWERVFALATMASEDEGYSGFICNYVRDLVRSSNTGISSLTEYEWLRTPMCADGR